MLNLLLLACIFLDYLKIVKVDKLKSQILIEFTVALEKSRFMILFIAVLIYCLTALYPMRKSRFLIILP